MERQRHADQEEAVDQGIAGRLRPEGSIESDLVEDLNGPGARRLMLRVRRREPPRDRRVRRMGHCGEEGPVVTVEPQPAGKGGKAEDDDESQE